MKPYIVLHMGSSIDGRIVPKHWPKQQTALLTEAYERIHDELAGDAWLVGRVTMADFEEGGPRPVEAVEKYPRETFKAAESGPYAVAVDQGAKLHLNTGKINGDAVIMILPEDVPDDHLAELRRDGISYVFAGPSQIDLALAMDVLARDFGIERLLLEGGGGINGSFLAAGLIDEISLLVLPVADGAANMPSLFDRPGQDAVKLSLKGVDRLEHDVLHLRYAVIPEG